MGDGLVDTVEESLTVAMDAPPGLTPRPARKNVMLAASISAGGDSVPVRIRNLSRAGVMIDGPTLPDVGSALRLSRLELSVAATAIWNREGRCGLSLESPIAVDDWIAGVSTTGGTVSLGQSRVDQLQAAIRSGAALPAETRASAPKPADVGLIEQNIASELARVKRTLDEVGEELADDIDVLMRHERAMQRFDIAAAIVDELARVMAAPDRESAVASVQMHELRSRLSDRPTLT